MGWFAIGIDPLLLLLERKLQGIQICSLPAAGPLEMTQVMLPPVEERYKVYGLADDVKASVSCMSEFSVIEDAVKLFESSSGNLLCKREMQGASTGEMEEHPAAGGHQTATLQTLR